MTEHRAASVLVVYNFVGEDEYERLKDVDPKSLDFDPEYDIKVPTVIEEYEAVAKALREQGYRARTFNIKEDLPRLERRIKRNPPDVVFNLVEFFHDDPELEQYIAGLFELHRIAYTGSSPFALGLCHKKGMVKQLLLAHGVATPRFVLLHEPRVPKRPKLNFPLIVKPAREDASAGIERESVVSDETQLAERLKYVFGEFAPPVLVEEFIDGTELHVAVLGNDDAEVLPPIEWDFSDLPGDHPPIISFAAKWNPLSEVYHRVHSICPARLSTQMLRKVERTVLKAYQVTGCRDYARLDVRLGEDGKVYVLEVNPNPDLTEGVSLMEAAEHADYSFSETLAIIVEYALERKTELEEWEERRKRLQTKPGSPEALTATLDGIPSDAPSRDARPSKGD